MSFRDEFVELSQNKVFEINNADIDELLACVAEGMKNVIRQRSCGIYKDNPLAKKEYRYCYYCFIKFVSKSPDNTWTCHKPDDSYSDYKFVYGVNEINYFFAKLLDTYDSVTVVVEPRTNVRATQIKGVPQATNLIAPEKTIKLSVFLNCDANGVIF